MVLQTTPQQKYFVLKPLGDLELDPLILSYDARFAHYEVLQLPESEVSEPPPADEEPLPPAETSEPPKIFCLPKELFERTPRIDLVPMKHPTTSHCTQKSWRKMVEGRDLICNADFCLSFESAMNPSYKCKPLHIRYFSH